MKPTAPVDVDLWISDEDLAELALSLERIITRSRERPLADRAVFFADYLEAE